MENFAAARGNDILDGQNGTDINSIGIAVGFKKCSYSISKGQIKTAPSRQITSFKSCTKLN